MSHTVREALPLGGARAAPGKALCRASGYGRAKRDVRQGDTEIHGTGLTVSPPRPFGRVYGLASSPFGRMCSGGRSFDRPPSPTYFRERYGVSNPYCLDLVAFHRPFYTRANPTVIFLDIVDQPTYGRRPRAADTVR